VDVYRVLSHSAVENGGTCCPSNARHYNAGHDVPGISSSDVRCPSHVELPLFLGQIWTGRQFNTGFFAIEPAHAWPPTSYNRPNTAIFRTNLRRARTVGAGADINLGWRGYRDRETGLEVSGRCSCWEGYRGNPEPDECVREWTNWTPRQPLLLTMVYAIAVR
jgi:hypothetical protein